MATRQNGAAVLFATLLTAGNDCPAAGTSACASTIKILRFQSGMSVADAKRVQARLCQMGRFRTERSKKASPSVNGCALRHQGASTGSTWGHYIGMSLPWRFL